MRKENLLQEIKELEQQMIADRRFLHQHPELSHQEYQTTRFVKERLAQFGLQPESLETDTGVSVLIRGGKPGKTICIRHDMDALPIQEETGLPFQSEVDGVSHACGHDIHTATLLTFAQILSSRKELVKGTVKFIFQAAEEKLPGGAKTLCEEGVMKDVDYVFGLHCSSGFPLGTVAVTPGAYSAAIGIYEVTVHGKGGHGSSPNTALNPVPVACMVGNSLNQLMAEKKSPTESGVLTVSYINGGQYPNIIPGEVTLGGNIRTLDNTLIQKLFDCVGSVSRGICEGFGLTCDVSTTVGYPAAINVPEYIEVVRTVARDLDYTVYERPDALGGEDFAYYLLEKPGAFFQIGMADPERPITSTPHHNCHFQLDERGFRIGLEMELGLYLRMTGQM